MQNLAISSHFCFFLPKIFTSAPEPAARTAAIHPTGPVPPKTRTERLLK